jgi:hypothetical protein
MRRKQVQKMNGAEWDWTCKRTRRMCRYYRRPGWGKFWKKSMSRRLRRLPIERDDE